LKSDSVFFGTRTHSTTPRRIPTGRGEKRYPQITCERGSFSEEIFSHNLKKNFECIRQRARQRALERLGNLPDTATDPSTRVSNLQATGTADSTQNPMNEQETEEQVTTHPTSTMTTMANSTINSTSPTSMGPTAYSYYYYYYYYDGCHYDYYRYYSFYYYRYGH
jgi:hypothetical protein